MVAVNKQQQLLDAVQRSLKRVRGTLFSEWWKHVIDSKTSDERKSKTAKNVEVANTVIDTLTQMQQDCQKEIERLKSSQNLQLEPGVSPNYYQQRDPTLLVGGVSSSWEHDYLEKLQVRLDSQNVADGLRLPGFETKNFLGCVLQALCLPKYLSKSVHRPSLWLRNLSHSILQVQTQFFQHSSNSPPFTTNCPKPNLKKTRLVCAGFAVTREVGCCLFQNLLIPCTSPISRVISSPIHLA